MEKQVISSGITASEKKKLRSLLTKKGRTKEKLFLAEGIRLLEESLKFNLLPQKVYYSHALAGSRAERLIGEFKKSSVPVRSISAIDMKRISDAETSQGMLGLFNIPEYAMDELLENDNKRILLLDNVSDPGNAGTLIRSALAFGFDSVMVLANSADPFGPKVVRSTVGAIFGLKVVSVKPADIRNIVERKKFPLIAADLNGQRLNIGLKRVKLQKGFIFAIGSEGAGLSSEIKKLANIRLKIYHERSVESLNAAVAGSIIMKELYDRMTGRAKP